MYKLDSSFAFSENEGIVCTEEHGINISGKK